MNDEAQTVVALHAIEALKGAARAVEVHSLATVYAAAYDAHPTDEGCDALNGYAAWATKNFAKLVGITLPE